MIPSLNRNTPFQSSLNMPTQQLFTSIFPSSRASLSSWRPARFEPTAFEAHKPAHAAQTLTGIRHLQFLEGDGLKCNTFDEWAKAFKPTMLLLNWVSETEKKIYSLQSQLLRLDKIPSALVDFKQWFTLLKDSDSPMSKDVATHWLRNHMTPGLVAELERDFGGENQL